MGRGLYRQPWPPARKHFNRKKAADTFRVHIEGENTERAPIADAEKVTVKEVCESFVEHCVGRE